MAKATPDRNSGHTSARPKPGTSGNTGAKAVRGSASPRVSAAYGYRSSGAAPESSGTYARGAMTESTHGKPTNGPHIQTAAQQAWGQHVCYAKPDSLKSGPSGTRKAAVNEVQAARPTRRK